MIEYRVRNGLTDEQLAPMWGKVLTNAERSVTVTGPAKVLKPNGDPLLIYLPGWIPQQLREESYATLHDLRRFETDNRGLASGMERYQIGQQKRTRTAPVASTIVGAFDPVGQYRYCRLTAWTGRETERFAGLQPLFKNISEAFAKHVPDRFAVQSVQAALTNDEWVVRGTPFTTITVNNTYPTGVHVDKGDLHEGFSCLAALRRGNYVGGILTMPKYRIGVDMQDGDVLLMDAHEAHGNTHLYCVGCGNAIANGGPLAMPKVQTPMRGLCEDHGTERISIVCYYRTKVKECGTAEEEGQKKLASAERNALLDEDDEAKAMAEAVVQTEGA